MCDVYSSVAPERYDCTTRSIRMRGFVTSVRLENEFWDILELIAREQSYTTPEFIAELYDEVTEASGHVANLASILRVACAVYLTRSVTGDTAPVAAKISKLEKSDKLPVV